MKWTKQASTIWGRADSRKVLKKKNRRAAQEVNVQSHTPKDYRDPQTLKSVLDKLDYLQHNGHEQLVLENAAVLQGWAHATSHFAEHPTHFEGFFRNLMGAEGGSMFSAFNVKLRLHKQLPLSQEEFKAYFYQIAKNLAKQEKR